MRTARVCDVRFFFQSDKINVSFKFIEKFVRTAIQSHTHSLNQRFKIKDQIMVLPSKVPVPLRLRSLYDSLNNNLKVISLAPICNLRKHKHAGKKLHNLHAHSYYKTGDCTIVRLLTIQWD